MAKGPLVATYELDMFSRVGLAASTVDSVVLRAGGQRKPGVWCRRFLSAGLKF